MNTVNRLKLRNGVIYEGHTITITEDTVFVDHDAIMEEYDSIEYAYAYAKQYITSLNIVESTNTVTNESIVNTIKKYYDIRITNTLVEEYHNVIDEDIFSLDPVVLELKEGKSSFINKLEFELDDGTNVAINESTYKKLLDLNVDKYKLVQFMKESKDNFTSIIEMVLEEENS